MNLGERVRDWRLNAKLSVAELARLVKTSRQNIENLESGSVRQPGYLRSLAAAIGVSTDVLLDPGKPLPPPDAVRIADALASQENCAQNAVIHSRDVVVVPLLNMPPPLRGEVSAAEPPPALGSVPASGEVGANGYALRVSGPSMINPAGAPSFPPGCLIFVNPTIEPKPGHFIVGMCPGDPDFTFKRLIQDGGRRYLESLNPKFDLIPVLPDFEIRGVVVGMGQDNLY